MKRTILVLLFAALATSLFAQTAEIGLKRTADIKASIDTLTSTNDQIDQFTDGLALAQSSEAAVAARQTQLIATGEGLKTDFRAIHAEILQQRAACPDKTTDEALWARCQEWAKRLDARTKEWTGRKNVLYADMKQWDADTAAAAQVTFHWQYSLDNLKRSRDRILGDLEGLNKQVRDCRAAIVNGTDEEMVELCGQLFDGNMLHPALINQGTGSHTFGR